MVQILFSKDNVEDVLRISDRLQVIPVKDACAIWLEKEMDAFNVLETLLLCVAHSSPVLALCFSLLSGSACRQNCTRRAQYQQTCTSWSVLRQLLFCLQCHRSPAISS